MKNGYYTDKSGNCLGYWELEQKPKDTDDYKWIESVERPAIYKSAEDIQKEEAAQKREAAIQALVDGKVSIDYLIANKAKLEAVLAKEVIKP